MRKIKKSFIRVLVSYVIIYVILGSSCSVFAAKRNYDEACGEYLAQYAVDFCNKYGGDSYYDNSFAVVEPDSMFFEGGSFGQGTFHTCCTVGVAYMYYKALGVNIIDLGADMGCPNHDSMKSNSNWVYISNESDLKPGDIIYNEHHAEMIIHDGHHVNFGNDPNSGIVQEEEYGFQNGTFCCGFRLSSSIEVDPSGKVAGTGTKATGQQIDYSNFFFNGIPDGKYSLASADSLWDIIVEALKGMLDYFVGYLTYIIRIIIVGITALFDKLLNNAVQSLNNAVPKSLIESGVTATVVQDDESEDRAVTIESLVFDQLELLNVNIFK